MWLFCLECHSLFALGRHQVLYCRLKPQILVFYRFCPHFRCFNFVAITKYVLTLYCLNNIHACLFVYPLLFFSLYCWLPNGMKWFLPYKTEKDLFVCSVVLLFLSVLNVWSELNLFSEDCSSIGSYWFITSMNILFGEQPLGQATDLYACLWTRLLWNGVWPKQAPLFSACLSHVCFQAFIWRHRCCCLQVWFVRESLSLQADM